MTCTVEHATQEDRDHCTRATLFERVAREAKGLLEARERLMTLMGTGQPWDDQQIVVQNCVKSLEASVREADMAGLFKS